MKNKPNDIFYCNVNKNKILNVSPILNEINLKHFYEWINERYKIHVKKDVQKLSKPWTKNKVLQRYKFCNVRREHDKESIWLIKNIISSNLSYKNKLLNIILFRLINKSETIKIFGLLDFNDKNIQKIKQKLSNFKNKNLNYIYFSNAFFTSGPKVVANKIFPEENNMIIKIILLVNEYKKLGLIKCIIKSKTQKEVFEILSSMQGIGKFLAYQIFVDFSYMKEFSFSENEFVVSGPGCEKGLNLLFKNRNNLTDEELLFWLRDNQMNVLDKFGYDPDRLFSDLSKEDRYLNVMSLENCMCELSKYVRATNGTGRPRIRYEGR
jgi:hypothetical protein